MSYCRFSDDSDVYVFGSGYALECYVAGALVGDGDREIYMVAMTDREPERKMWNHLVELRGKGLKIPQRALDRLDAEARERLQVFITKT